MELEKGGTSQIHVWISTYDVAEERVRGLQEGLDGLLARLFRRVPTPEPAGSESR